MYVAVAVVAAALAAVVVVVEREKITFQNSNLFQFPSRRRRGRQQKSCTFLRLDRFQIVSNILYHKYSFMQFYCSCVNHAF